MQPTYNRPAPTANPWQLGPTASKIARWVFGLGFFSVHLGVFLIVGLTLLMLNLYRSPSDLWVGGPLFRWGIIVVIHGLGAVVTWAITTAIDAAEATRRATVRYEPPRPAPMIPPSPTVPRITEPSAPPRTRFQPGHSRPVETNDVNDRRGRFRGRRGDVEESAPHRPSPPGWTVMRPGEPAPDAPAVRAPASGSPAWTQQTTIPTAPSAPAAPPIRPDPDDTRSTAEDNRWTWVEAAAEAWLANRNDKAGSKADSSGDTPS